MPLAFHVTLEFYSLPGLVFLQVPLVVYMILESYYCTPLIVPGPVPPSCPSPAQLCRFAILSSSATTQASPVLVTPCLFSEVCYLTLSVELILDRQWLEYG